MITVYDIEVAVFFRLFHQILLILELLMIIPGLLIILACGRSFFAKSLSQLQDISSSFVSHSSTVMFTC